jgi:hypothetical protein
MNRAEFIGALNSHRRSRGRARASPPFVSMPAHLRKLFRCANFADEARAGVARHGDEIRACFYE